MGRPKNKVEYVVEPGYFVSDDDIAQLNKEMKLTSSDLLRAKQWVVDSDFVKVTEWQRAPELYMKEVLGFSPWTCPDADDQLDICHAVRDFPRVTVRSGNGVGKTAIAGRIAMWFLTCFYGSQVITTAPTTRQVEKLLWGEIRSAYRESKIPIGGELLNTQVRLGDKWFAVGFATDEKEKFQGFHAPYILVIVDEASGVNEMIFEAIEGLLTTGGARILLIGNPTDPASYFGRTFLHPRESKGWEHLHISCWNSPNVRAGKEILPAVCAADWPRQRLRQWGEYNPFYQVRVLGNFPDSGEDNLIPYHMVHAALERTMIPEGSKVFGVDVARFGDDASVIGKLHGGQYRILKKSFHQDGPGLARKIIELLYKPENEDVSEVRVDVIGWGASCYDHLKEMKVRGSEVEKKRLKSVRLVPVNVSEKSKSKEARKNYKNIRAETGFIIREMFEQGQVDIDDEELAVQAANMKYKYDASEGKQLLEKKEDYKARLRKSPDEFDSLIMAKAITRGASPSVW